jgi:hypothetical protein
MKLKLILSCRNCSLILQSSHFIRGEAWISEEDNWKNVLSHKEWKAEHRNRQGKGLALNPIQGQTGDLWSKSTPHSCILTKRFDFVRTLCTTLLSFAFWRQPILTSPILSKPIVSSSLSLSSLSSYAIKTSPPSQASSPPPPTPTL